MSMSVSYYALCLPSVAWSRFEGKDSIIDDVGRWREEVYSLCLGEDVKPEM